MSLLKNIAKSLAERTVPTVAGNIFSNESNRLTDFNEKLDSAKEIFKKAREEVKSTGAAFQAGPITENLKQQLRSGKFGTSAADAEEQMMKSMGMDFGDMDFGDMDADATSSFSDGDDFEMDDGSQGGDSTINNNVDNNTYNLYNMPSKIPTGGVTEGDGLLNERLTINNRVSNRIGQHTIGLMSRQTAILSNIEAFLTNNTQPHYETVNGLAQGTTEGLQSLVEKFESVEKYTTIKLEQITEERNNKIAEELDFDGIMDPASLMKKMVSGNFEMLFGEASPIKGLITNAVTDPLGHLVAFGMSQSIGKAFGGQIDKIHKFTNSLNARLQSTFEGWADTQAIGLDRGDLSTDSIKKFIGENLRVKRDREFNVARGKYQEGRVDFDGKTRHSIISVIPGYLAKILAAVKGTDDMEVFDYETSSFQSSKKLTEKYQEDIKKVDDNEYLGGIQGSIKSLLQEQGIYGDDLNSIRNKISDMAISQDAAKSDVTKMSLGDERLDSIYQSALEKSSREDLADLDSTFRNTSIERSMQLEKLNKEFAGSAMEQAAILSGNTQYKLRKGDRIEDGKIVKSTDDDSPTGEIGDDEPKGPDSGSSPDSAKGILDRLFDSVSKPFRSLSNRVGNLMFGDKSKGTKGLLGGIGASITKNIVNPAKDFLVGKDYDATGEVSFLDAIKNRFNVNILAPMKGLLLGSKDKSVNESTSFLDSIKYRFNTSVLNPLKRLTLGKDYDGDQGEIGFLDSIKYRFNKSVLSPLSGMLLGQHYKGDKSKVGFVDSIKFRFTESVLNPLKGALLGTKNRRAVEGNSLFDSISFRMNKTILRPLKGALLGTKNNETINKTSFMDTVKFRFNESILTPLKSALMGEDDLEKVRGTSFLTSLNTGLNNTILMPLKTALVGEKDAQSMGLFASINASFAKNVMLPLKQSLLGDDSDKDAMKTSFLGAVSEGFDRTIFTPMKSMLFGEENKGKGLFENIGEITSPFFNKLLFGEDKASKLGFLENAKTEGKLLWGSMWDGLNNSVFAPMKDAMGELFGPVFKDFRETLGTEIKSFGSSLFSNVRDGVSVGAKGMMKNIFGDETLNILRDNIVTPLKELSDNLTDKMGTAFKFLLRLPVNFFRGVTDTMKIKQMNKGDRVFSEEETTRLKGLEESGKIFNFMDKGKPKEGEDGEKKGFFSRFKDAYGKRRGASALENTEGTLGNVKEGKLDAISATADKGSPKFMGETLTTINTSIRDVLNVISKKFTKDNAVQDLSGVGTTDGAILETGKFSSRALSDLPKLISGADSSTDLLSFARNNLTSLDSRLESIVKLLRKQNGMETAVSEKKSGGSSIFRNPIKWAMGKVKGVVGIATNLVSSALGSITKVAGSILSIPGKIAGSLGDLISGGINLTLKLGKGIADGIASISGSLLSAASSIISSLASMGASLVDGVSSIMSSLASGIATTVSAIAKPLAGAIGDITVTLAKGIGGLTKILTNTLTSVLSGLAEVSKATISTMWGVTKGVANFISGGRLGGAKIGVTAGVNVKNFDVLLGNSKLNPMHVYVTGGNITTHQPKKLKQTTFSDKAETRSLLGDVVKGDGKKKEDGGFLSSIGSFLGDILGTVLPAGLAAKMGLSSLSNLIPGMGGKGKTTTGGIVPDIGGGSPKKVPKGKAGIFKRIINKVTGKGGKAAAQTAGTTVATRTAQTATTSSAATKIAAAKGGVREAVAKKAASRGGVKIAEKAVLQTATKGTKRTLLSSLAKNVKGGGVKGIGIGMAASIGGGMAADMLFEEGGAAHAITSKTASWAGMGAMIGSIFPVIGTGIGAAIGGVLGALTEIVPRTIDWVEEKFETQIKGITDFMIKIPERIALWAEEFPAKVETFMHDLPITMGKWVTSLPGKIASMFMSDDPEVNEDGTITEKKPSILGAMFKAVGSAVWQIAKMIPKIIGSIGKAIAGGIKGYAIGSATAVMNGVKDTVGAAGDAVSNLHTRASIAIRRKLPNMFGGISDEEADAELAEMEKSKDTNRKTREANTITFEQAKNPNAFMDSSKPVSQNMDVYKDALEQSKGNTAEADALYRKNKADDKIVEAKQDALRKETEEFRNSANIAANDPTMSSPSSSIISPKEYHTNKDTTVKENKLNYKSDPGIYTKDEINSILNEVADTSGIPYNVLSTIADVESNKRHWVTNNFDYAGLFQMGKNEFAKFSPNPEGSRLDPKLNALAASNYMLYHSKGLTDRNIPPTPENIYLAHQQGLGGINQLYKASRGEITLEAAALNRMAKNPPQDGKGPTTNPSEFLNRWTATMSKKYGRPVEEPFPMSVADKMGGLAANGDSGDVEVDMDDAATRQVLDSFFNSDLAAMNDAVGATTMAGLGKTYVKPEYNDTFDGDASVGVSPPQLGTQSMNTHLINDDDDSSPTVVSRNENGSNSAVHTTHMAQAASAPITKEAGESDEALALRILLSEIKIQTNILEGIKSNTAETSNMFIDGNTTPTPLMVNNTTTNKTLSQQLMEDSFPMSMRPRQGAINVSKTSMAM